jgi:hypothetical protein
MKTGAYHHADIIRYRDCRGVVCIVGHAEIEPPSLGPLLPNL